MIPNRSTPVPNIIFDAYLPILKPTEVALLFVVIRQTLGWVNTRTMQRKYKDWLTGSKLRDKTGYSRKAISTALEGLISYRLIKVFDSKGNELYKAQLRQGKTRLYYAFSLPENLSLDHIACVESTQYMRSFYAQQKKLLLNKMTMS